MTRNTTQSTQEIEMTARQLRMLAESMGICDVVTVTVDRRLAEGYWSLRAATPEVMA